jgi:hypothetical protein
MGGIEMFELPQSRRVTQAYARYGAVVLTTIVLWLIAGMFLAIGLISLSPNSDSGARSSGLAIASWFVAAALCFVASIIIDVRILSQRSLRFLPFVYIGVLAVAIGVSQVAPHL